jgi:hypothetical protein
MRGLSTDAEGRGTRWGCEVEEKAIDFLSIDNLCIGQDRKHGEEE